VVDRLEGDGLPGSFTFDEEDLEAEDGSPGVFQVEGDGRHEPLRFAGVPGHDFGAAAYRGRLDLDDVEVTGFSLTPAGEDRLGETLRRVASGFARGPLVQGEEPSFDDPFRALLGCTSGREEGDERDRDHASPHAVTASSIATRFASFVSGT